MNDHASSENDAIEPRYIGFERGLSKPELDAICKKLFPLEFEKIQKGHLRTSVDLFLEEQLPNAIQLIPYGDPKGPDALFAIGYDITGRSESYVAKEETSLRLKLGNSRVGIERVFGRMLRIDEFEEPSLPRPPAPAPTPEPAPARSGRPYQGRPQHGAEGQGQRQRQNHHSNAAPSPREPRAHGAPSDPRARPDRSPKDQQRPTQAPHDRPRDAKPKQFSR